MFITSKFRVFYYIQRMLNTVSCPDSPFTDL